MPEGVLLNAEEMSGLFLDFLRSDPATRDLPDLPAIAAAAAPLLREVVLTELSMAADEAEASVENPEHPWAQGVLSVVADLRGRVAG